MNDKESKDYKIIFEMNKKAWKDHNVSPQTALNSLISLVCATCADNKITKELFKELIEGAYQAYVEVLEDESE